LKPKAVRDVVEPVVRAAVVHLDVSALVDSTPLLTLAEEPMMVEETSSPATIDEPKAVDEPEAACSASETPVVTAETDALSDEDSGAAFSSSLSTDVEPGEEVELF
jgi:hypothetical protein